MSARELTESPSIKYVCPDCKSELQDLMCVRCNVQFLEGNGIPNLLSKEARFESAAKISATYDDIYDKHSNVWEDQGRPGKFIDYCSALVATFSTGRVLEVGCGEGILLAAIKAEQKTATDISVLALRKTRERTGAECAVAIAERLPYPDGVFDAVLSIGVMEHFIDDDAAMSEICRVLQPGGVCVTLVHTAMTTGESMQQKLREFVFPRPRPIRVMRWLYKKLVHPIHQPVQNRYTAASSRACMERNGFAVERTISMQDAPPPPLGGPHVRIFVARKT